MKHHTTHARTHLHTYNIAQIHTCVRACKHTHRRRYASSNAAPTLGMKRSRSANTCQHTYPNTHTHARTSHNTLTYIHIFPHSPSNTHHYTRVHPYTPISHICTHTHIYMPVHMHNHKQLAMHTCKHIHTTVQTHTVPTLTICDAGTNGARVHLSVQCNNHSVQRQCVNPVQRPRQQCTRQSVNPVQRPRQTKQCGTPIHRLQCTWEICQSNTTTQ